MELATGIKKEKQQPFISVRTWFFGGYDKWVPVGAEKDDRRRKLKRIAKTYILPGFRVFFNRRWEGDKLVYTKMLRCGLSKDFGLYMEREELPDNVGYTLEIKWQILWFYVRYNDFVWK